MTHENLTAALINGLNRAWATFKQGPFESSQATMTLLAVQSLALDFGIDEPSAQPRVYRLGLSLTAAEADIEFVRSEGTQPPDDFDEHLTGLLLEAFELELAPALKNPSGLIAEADLAELPSPSGLLH